MNHQELYKFIKSVQKNVRCPQCGKAYEFSNIEIRGIVDSIMFLELHCGSHMPLLATVTMTKNVKKLGKNQEKVNSNDVIETYKFLKQFQGNFSEIFENNKPPKPTNKK